MDEGLSILFGCVDREHRAIDLIRSIHGFTGVPYEVIVADASRGHMLWDFVVSGEIPTGRVKYFRDDARLGYSHAYNQAACIAEKKHIVWLNDDCLVRPGWAEPVISFMDTTPNVGVGGISFDEGERRAVALRIFGQYVANFGCIPTELWHTMNGFDVSFRDYGAESDLCLRVKDTGRIVAPVPGVCISHFRDHDDNHMEMLKRRSESRAYFAAKWRNHRWH